MAVEGEGKNYEALAEQELALAAAAVDRDAKTRHLNQAALYATLHEQSRAPHRPNIRPE